MDTVRVGVGTADITPPVGMASAGFAARGPLSALHDPLMAVALVVSKGERVLTLVSCDLIDLDAATVSAIRKQVEQRVGIPGCAVSVACTHTHYGPDPYRDTSDAAVMAYRAQLIERVSGAVAKAASRREPALLGVGWGASDIGVNRREKLPDGRVILGKNAEGPIDRSVGVLRVNARDGRAIACAVNFQAHPVSQTGQVSHISADYVGKMRQIVRDRTGAECLFLQGACGDINAAWMEARYEPADALGTKLASEVVKVWGTIQTGVTSQLQIESAHVKLPRIRYASQEQAEELVQSLETALERHRTEDTAPGLVRWMKQRLQRAREALVSWQKGRPLEPIDAELQGCRIDDLALVASPGELFNQIGTAVKDRSPFKDTFFVGYANDSLGYVPVPEVYAEGGYEVMQASRVGPDAANLIIAGSLELLERLAGDDPGTREA